MNLNLSLSLALTVPLTLSIACEFEEELESDVLAARGDECLQCGRNSMALSGVPFHDIALDGVMPNNQGVRLVEVRDGFGKKLELEVVGDRLLRKTPGSRTDAVELQVGTTFLFERAINKKGKGGNPRVERSKLRLVETKKIDFWVSGHSILDPKATSYKFTFDGSLLGSEGFCPTNLEHGDVPGPPDDTIADPNGQPSYNFVIIAGQRYDVETMTLREGKGWINFACSQSVLAKMHLTGHTNSSTAALAVEMRRETTQDEQQALLKMYVADYCGDGHSYTVTGERLRFTNEYDWFDDMHPESEGVSSYEAIWDQNGAVCLTTPRLGQEKIVCPQRVIEECAPANLSEDPADWKDLGYLISANPWIDPNGDIGFGDQTGYVDPTPPSEYSN